MAWREFVEGTHERRMTMQTTLKRKRLSILYVAVPVLTLIATLIVVTAAARPDTHVIQVPADYPTIQAAVNAANEGDAIMVSVSDLGAYQENVVITTSNLRLHATTGVVLDGAAVHGVGINVHGTSSNPVARVEVSGFEIRNFTEGMLALNATGVQLHHNDVHDNEVALGKLPGLGLGV